MTAALSEGTIADTVAGEIEAIRIENGPRRAAAWVGAIFDQAGTVIRTRLRHAIEISKNGIASTIGIPEILPRTTQR